MDAIPFHAPHTVLYSILFTTIIAVTADRPAAVPAVFLRLLLHYQAFQEVRRMKAAERSGEKFWEIDMTKFEP